MLAILTGFRVSKHKMFTHGIISCFSSRVKTIFIQKLLMAFLADIQRGKDV